MTTFFCTKKLQRAFGLTPTPAEHPSTARLGNWYANTIRLERRTAILFTNEKTLFSFVMLKGKARTIDKLHFSFMRGLAMSLALEGHRDKDIEELVNDYGLRPAIGAASDRRVLGTMNQIALDLDFILYSRGGLNACDLGDLIHRINNTPWQATDYNFSSKLVSQLAQSRAH